jgi:hypothetical protein
LKEQEITDFVRQMKPTDHVVLFYSKPEDKREVLFTFLKAGLDQGKAAAYVATQESPDVIRHAMQAFGIDVGRLENSGALHVFPYKDLYFKGGRFSIPNVMGLWKTLYEDATAKGFKGFRAAGEMACFFKEKAIKELVEYERALGRSFEMPLEGICAYDANDLAEKGGLYLDLIKAHKAVIITGPLGGVVSSY